MACRDQPASSPCDPEPPLGDRSGLPLPTTPEASSLFRIRTLCCSHHGPGSRTRLVRRGALAAILSIMVPARESPGPLGKPAAQPSLLVSIAWRGDRNLCAQRSPVRHWRAQMRSSVRIQCDALWPPLAPSPCPLPAFFGLFPLARAHCDRPSSGETPSRNPSMVRPAHARACAHCVSCAVAPTGPPGPSGPLGNKKAYRHATLRKIQRPLSIHPPSLRWSRPSGAARTGDAAAVGCALAENSARRGSREPARQWRRAGGRRDASRDWRFGTVNRDRAGGWAGRD